MQARARGLGLRHLLPVLFTVSYAMLIVSGYRQQHSSDAIFKPRLSQDEVLFDLPPVPPLPIRLAIGINLPAALAALPAVFVAEWLEPSVLEHGIVGYVIIGVFVPGLWWLIGRRLDRRLGWLPPLQRKPIPRLLLRIPFFTLLVFDWFLLLAFRSDHYHGVLVLSCVIWVSLLVIALYLKMRLRESRENG